jgi:hypothetical protein
MRALRTVAFFFLAASAFAQQQEPTPEAKRMLEERMKGVEVSTALRLQAAGVVSACGSDFETGLAEWTTAHGFVNRDGSLYFPSPITAARHTLVGPGTDPIVGISTVAPGGSTRALKLGDTDVGAEAELIEKTFIVREPVISFSYAVVFQEPGHHDFEQPAFLVRVLDAEGKIVAVPMKLFAKKDDLSYVTIPQTGSAPVQYRDWTCAQIDLSKWAGEQVTIQIIAADCALTGHYAYAYIDDFCGTCGSSLTFDPAGSTTCGRGKLCFDYRLPVTEPASELVVELTLLQNRMPAAVLTFKIVDPAKSSHCFTIDDALLARLSSSPDFFDFAAVGRFTVAGQSFATIAVGSATEGIRGGANNDYEIACGTPGCCPGSNYIANGDFEAGDTGFTSEYGPVVGPAGAGAVPPEHYAVVDSRQAIAIASTWNVRSYGLPPCDETKKYLAVNGASCGAGRRLVWSQRASVFDAVDYRFCANFRNLPQNAFDVKPRVELVLKTLGQVVTVPVVIDVSAADSCLWTLESATIRVPEGETAVTCEIWLDDSVAGDGNDLAIDDISLQEIARADPKLAEISVVASEVRGGTYNVTATPLHGQPLDFAWSVCEIDAAGDCIAATRVAAPPQWSVKGPFSFPGYDGTSTLVAGEPVAGVFLAAKRYAITYAVFALCTARVERRWTIPPGGGGTLRPSREP